MENDCRAGRPQMTIKYCACALHAVCLRIQKQPKNMTHLLILYTTIVQQTLLNLTLYLIACVVPCYFLGKAEIQNILH